MTVANELKIVLTADDQASSKLGGVKSTLQGIGKVAAGAVVGGLAIAGTAIAATAVKGITEFTAFQDQMNEVFTLLPGISGAAMDEMRAQVLAASTDMGRLPNEVVPALYQSLSAGVPPGNVFDFLETAHQAALGGVTELETAVDGISSVVNAYGSEVIDATGASDLMFTAVRLGKTTFGELSSSLSNVTPIAAAMGVNFGDVTAALAAMTSQGTPTAQATVQMRALLQELGTAGTEVADTFSDLAGQSFMDFVAEGGNVAGALQMLEQHAIDTGVPIQDMFGNVRAGLGALQLTGAGMETFVGNLNEMAGSAGATEAAYETMNSGIARTFEQIKANVTTTLIRIGDALAPFVSVVAEKLIGVFEQLTPIIDDVVTAFQFLFDVISNSGVEGLFTVFEDGSIQIEGFFKKLGIGGETAHQLAQTMVNIKNTLTEFIDNVRELLTPIIDAVANFVSWKDILIALGVAVASVVIPAIISIITTLAPIIAVIAAVIAVIALLRNAWENNWLGIRDIVGNVIEVVRGIIESALTWIREFWAENGEQIIETATQIWETIKTAITTAITIVQNIVRDVLTLIQAFWAEHGETIMAVASAAWQRIQAVIETIITTVSTVVQTVLAAIRQFWTDHGAEIMEAAQTAWDFIKGIIETVLNIIGTIFSAFAAAFEGDWRAFGEILRDAWDEAWQLIQDVFTTVGDAILEFLAGLILDMIAKFQSTDWIQLGKDIIQGIANGISAAASIIKDAALAAAQAAWNAVKGFFGMDSPSKLMFDAGIDVGEGLALGILSMQRRVSDAFIDLLNPQRPFEFNAAISEPAGIGFGAPAPFAPQTTTTNEFHLHVTTVDDPAAIIAEFETLQALVVE